MKKCRTVNRILMSHKSSIQTMHTLNSSNKWMQQLNLLSPKLILLAQKKTLRNIFSRPKRNEKQTPLFKLTHLFQNQWWWTKTSNAPHKMILQGPTHSHYWRCQKFKCSSHRLHSLWQNLSQLRPHQTKLLLIAENLFQNRPKLTS